MKKLISGLLLAMVLFGAASTAFAAVEVSGDAYAGVYSKYVWRGIDLSQDDSVVVQGGTDISLGGFTISWWGNLSENSGELNEVDVILDYSTDLTDMVSLSVGNILYDIDNFLVDPITDEVSAGSTNEVYLGLTLNVPLSPTFTAYYDYDEFDSTYLTLGISHDFELSEALALSLGATGSYLIDDPKLWGTKEEWFNNLDLSVGADYAVTEQISVGASLLYSAPLSERAKRNVGIREEYTGGAAVTFSF